MIGFISKSMLQFTVSNYHLTSNMYKMANMQPIGTDVRSTEKAFYPGK